VTELCDFKHHNPTVLMWLKIFTNSKKTRTQQIVQLTFLQESITNCTFSVILSVQSVYH